MLRLDAAQRVTATRCAVAFVGIALAAGTALAQSGAMPSRGKPKSVVCESCHGAPGRQGLPGVPYLAGQQELFLSLQMFLFREGLREAPQMAGMLSGYSDRDLADVAAHFARQTPPGGSAPTDAKLHARGAALARAMGCGSCHLEDYSGQKQVPRLANLPERYLAETMKAYRDSKRAGSDTSMNGILYQVPDADIEALAHFLAHQ